MTLEKAIKILKADLLRPGSVDKLDFQDAEQLGIEAMNAWQTSRKFTSIHQVPLLKGETED